MVFGRFKEEFGRASPTIEELEASGSLSDPYRAIRFEIAAQYGYVQDNLPQSPPITPIATPTSFFPKLARALSRRRSESPTPISQRRHSRSPLPLNEPVVWSPPPSPEPSPYRPSTADVLLSPLRHLTSNSASAPDLTAHEPSTPCQVRPSQPQRSFSAPFILLSRRVSLLGPRRSPSLEPIRRSFDVIRPVTHRSESLSLIPESPSRSRQEKLDFSKRSTPPSPASSKILSGLTSSRPPSPPISSPILLPLAANNMVILPSPSPLVLGTSAPSEGSSIEDKKIISVDEPNLIVSVVEPVANWNGVW